jgi:poly-beta-1,6-N-acetyl-D-glucosamine synthase
MQWLLLIFITPYLFLLIRIYISLTHIRAWHPDSVSVQFISIIVACRNEEKRLPVLLKHLSEQDYNPDLFEVVIIDDNSSDSTLAIASGFEGIKNLISLQNSGTGKKSAIRCGVKASKGRVVVTTDADCTMRQNWLKTIALFFEENKPEMIICPVELEGKKGFFQRFQEIEFLSLQGITAGTAFSGKPVMCNGANLAFSKEIYNKYTSDLHDDLISGDDVFLLHAIKSNPVNKIIWLEAADGLVFTKTSEKVGAFLKQRARWISKAGAYKDSYTKLLGIVTFVTIFFQLSLLVAGIFNPVFLLVFLASYILKSVPDYLIIRNTAARYSNRSIMNQFIPAQLVYPFYIIAVFIYFLIAKK